jgi:membrane-associated phospholipid phosphatase
VFSATLPAIEHVERRFARRYADRLVRFTRFRPIVPLAVIVVVGGLLVAWFGHQFIELAEALRANNPKLQDFDTLAHAWAVSKRTPAETAFFKVMTTIGGPIGMAAIAGIVSIALIVTKRFRWLAYLVITAGGGGLLDWELKRYFARARPALADMLMRATGYSFPSGHAMGSTVVLLALSYLATRTATQWRWKAACLALAWTLIAAVALSRVYLGAHWMSDVAAGVAAGALWTGLTTISYETVRRIRTLRAHEQTGSSRSAG